MHLGLLGSPPYMRKWPEYFQAAVCQLMSRSSTAGANRCMSPQSPVTRRDQRKNVTRGGRERAHKRASRTAACALDKKTHSSFIIALCKFYLKPFGVLRAAAASEERRRDLVVRRPTVCPTCQTRRVRGCDWVMLVDTAATAPIIGPSSAARN